ncbi:hypothetical protein LPJ55_004159 [Coemansia sp. RSA 990]|nr:hypothetical protein LPJ79_003971 [Coemansia sp. RSA 1821]KAJ1871100.1 hypothetical protein LPJ55_004159 [Coemansia sp. RSA 990]
MIRHLIRESETLEGISVQYGISTADLKRLNRLWQPNEIATRKHLYIPLRLCLPKFTLDNIEHINKQYEDELRNRNVSDFQPIEVIEKVLSAEQRQALEALKRTANKSAPRSRKQAAVSPKIELMRLKAKATGNESIGMSDRLYFSVLWQDKAIAVFINRNSGVGNAACRFSKQLHLSQLPDKIYRLRIPGTDKPLPSNKTFSELLSAEDSSGSLYNGCKLELIC